MKKWTPSQIYEKNLLSILNNFYCPIFFIYFLGKLYISVLKLLT